MEGNQMKMREALVQCELFLGNVSRHGHPTLFIGDQCTACNVVDELRGMVVRALSAPPRNCDVGTAEEQVERFDQQCRGRIECASCPCLTFDDKCSILQWAQMPYESEEGGAK